VAPVALGGESALLYTTIHGAVGALLPLQHREDVDFLQKLESQMSSVGATVLVAGLAHMRHRSSAQGPPLHVYDGDLCEQYARLAAPVQRAIGTAVQREPIDVLRKLDQLRKQVM
jgi:splicing factor 3B subunit 3